MPARQLLTPNDEVAERGLCLAPELEPLEAEPILGEQTPLEAHCLSATTRLRLSSFATSAAVHAGLLLALALITTHPKVHSLATPLFSSIAPTEAALDLSGAEMSVESGGTPETSKVIGQDLVGLEPSEDFAPLSATAGLPVENPVESKQAMSSASTSANAGTGEPAESSFVGPPGGGLGGRAPGGRGKYATKRGATSQSEDAVELGLHWLAMHQRNNGSWSFDHHSESCNGECGNPGTHPSNNAATGLALLPFLGAGYTHKEGPYTENVRRGLYYLCKEMHMTEQGGDLHEGTMYAQGIAAIVLCEAYAMTDDQALKPYAQAAIDFIVHAQDRLGGGWRYTPGQPGDTTVFGWQLMSLRSAQLARLRVPSPTWSLAEKFLDSVQGEYGSSYGYQSPEGTDTTSAIGLLCRMYTGWERTRPGLVRGAGKLGRMGPSTHDMYFNYYATQVMHHLDGQAWQRWNRSMRDFLVQTQSHQGHEKGSWYFPDKHADVAGRLYTTSMAVMTLEVYYRYLPLYEEEAVKR